MIQKEKTMKRYLPVIFIVLFYLPSLACSLIFPNTIQGSGKIVTESVDVSGFDRISLDGSANVYIKQGQAESLTVEADDNILPLLESTVQAGELVLTTKPNQSINPSKPIVYRITVKELSGISLRGSGSFFVSPVESNAMDISVLGSGDINLEDLTTEKLSLTLSGSGTIAIARLTATSVDASVKGSGDIELAGTADSQTVSFSGSGSYQAGDLQTETTEVSIPGSAEVTVWATDALKASIDGSGTISYYGQPSVDQSGGGSGTLKSLGEK